ncbi:alpha/beta hydrolase [Vibrio misgurnus]|uniref:alpha/beta hydrolase n=1 Tax=Vibrio misgurnus TaxID=2993714 RepID=UPI0023F6F5A9|nr:alpha/beta hydrolase [Vibrio sp. VCS]
MNKNIIKVTFLAAAITLSSGFALAEDYRKNPFTLTYQDAITQNITGQINIHPVNYALNNINIVANVYTPANYNPSQKYPAIIVAHPNGGVKEQVAGLYAQRLADMGYITITSDAAYQGGGYSLKAAQTDKRFKSVAILSMFNSGIVRRNGYQDSQVATIQERLNQASAARTQEAKVSMV